MNTLQINPFQLHISVWLIHLLFIKYYQVEQIDQPPCQIAPWAVLHQGAAGLAGAGGAATRRAGARCRTLPGDRRARRPAAAAVRVSPAGEA